PVIVIGLDPVTGLGKGSGRSQPGMNGQVRLAFDSKEEAVAYAERHGIPFRLHEQNEAPTILKAYADNFAPNRKQPWTH
ncbi:MAG: NADH dehydrogenase ubiquinone Fe-S protein 4, partial [Phenylobacterium sp.]|nr:NADH dehydrogenase ubiquinone Fe-S protein 4 [Phenylobacterium sp.]